MLLAVGPSKLPEAAETLETHQPLAFWNITVPASARCDRRLSCTRLRWSFQNMRARRLIPRARGQYERQPKSFWPK